MVGKSKRPSIIDQVELTSIPIDTFSKQPAQPTRMATPLTKRDVQHTSVYLPRAAYDRLREIAFAERVKIHDLIMQGVDHVIAERGHLEKASRSDKS